MPVKQGPRAGPVMNHRQTARGHALDHRRMAAFGVGTGQDGPDAAIPFLHVRAGRVEPDRPGQIRIRENARELRLEPGAGVVLPAPDPFDLPWHGAAHRQLEPGVAGPQGHQKVDGPVKALVLERVDPHQAQGKARLGQLGALQFVPVDILRHHMHPLRRHAEPRHHQVAEILRHHDQRVDIVPLHPFGKIPEGLEPVQPDKQPGARTLVVAVPDGVFAAPFAQDRIHIGGHMRLPRGLDAAGPGLPTQPDTRIGQQPVGHLAQEFPLVGGDQDMARRGAQADARSPMPADRAPQLGGKRRSREPPGDLQGAVAGQIMGRGAPLLHDPADPRDDIALRDIDKIGIIRAEQRPVELAVVQDRRHPHGAELDDLGRDLDHVVIAVVTQAKGEIGPCHQRLGLHMRQVRMQLDMRKIALGDPGAQPVHPGKEIGMRLAAGILAGDQAQADLALGGGAGLEIRAKIEQPVETVLQVDLARIAQRCRPVVPGLGRAILEHHGRDRMHHMGGIIRKRFKRPLGGFALHHDRHPPLPPELHPFGFGLGDIRDRIGRIAHDPIAKGRLVQQPGQQFGTAHEDPVIGAVPRLPGQHDPGQIRDIEPAFGQRSGPPRRRAKHLGIAQGDPGGQLIGQQPGGQSVPQQQVGVEIRLQRQQLAGVQQPDRRPVDQVEILLGQNRNPHCAASRISARPSGRTSSNTALTVR